MHILLHLHRSGTHVLNCENASASSYFQTHGAVCKSCAPPTPAGDETGECCSHAERPPTARRPWTRRRRKGWTLSFCLHTAGATKKTHRLLHHEAVHHCLARLPDAIHPSHRLHLHGNIKLLVRAMPPNLVGSELLSCNETRSLCVPRQQYCRLCCASMQAHGRWQEEERSDVVGRRSAAPLVRGPAAAPPAPRAVLLSGSARWRPTVHRRCTNQTQRIPLGQSLGEDAVEEVRTWQNNVRWQNAPMM